MSKLLCLDRREHRWVSERGYMVCRVCRMEYQRPALRDELLDPAYDAQLAAAGVLADLGIAVREGDTR